MVVIGQMFFDNHFLVKKHIDNYLILKDFTKLYLAAVISVINLTNPNPVNTIGISKYSRFPLSTNRSGFVKCLRGKAGEAGGMRRTFLYAAMTDTKAQRSI